MSVESGGSTCVDDRVSIADTRFQTAVHNISRLFDRISAIEDELSQSKDALANPPGDEMWSDSSIADSGVKVKGKSDRIKMKDLKERYCSVPEPLSASRIESFRVSEAEEKRKFLELELQRVRDRAASAPTISRSIVSRRFKTRPHTAQQDPPDKTIAELSVTREEVKNLLRINALLRKKSQQASSEADRNRCEQARLKGRLSILRSENIRLSESIKDMTTQYSADLNNARDATKRAESLLVGSRAELDSARLRMQELSDQSNSIARELEKSRSAFDEQTTRLQELQLYKDRTTEDLKVLELRLTSIESKKLSQAKSLPQTESLVAQLVKQLTDAKEESLQAKSELEKYSIQLEDMRRHYTLAINKERQNRKKEIEQECFSLLSATGCLTQSIRRIDPVDNSSAVYLKRIRKLQNTVNDLTEKVTEYERRELRRAPVVVRKRSKSMGPNIGNSNSIPRSNLTHLSSHTSFLSDDGQETARDGPTEYE